MKHYAKEELELFRHGQMSVLGRINCASHLKECVECRELLQELEAEDDFVEELRCTLQIFGAISKETSSHSTQTAKS